MSDDGITFSSTSGWSVQLHGEEVTNKPLRFAGIAAGVASVAAAAMLSPLLAAVHYALVAMNRRGFVRDDGDTVTIDKDAFLKR